jgi:hypothetical protein
VLFRQHFSRFAGLRPSLHSPLLSSLLPLASNSITSGKGLFKMRNGRSTSSLALDRRDSDRLKASQTISLSCHRTPIACTLMETMGLTGLSSCATRMAVLGSARTWAISGCFGTSRATLPCHHLKSSLSQKKKGTEVDTVLLCVKLTNDLPIHVEMGQFVTG